MNFDFSCKKKLHRTKTTPEFREKRDYSDPTLWIPATFPSGEKFFVRPLKTSDLEHDPELREYLHRHKDFLVSIYVDYFYRFYKNKSLTMKQVIDNLNITCLRFLMERKNLDNLRRRGVKRVEMVAYLRDEICNYCLMMDGKVYDIDHAPIIPHYRCENNSKPRQHCRCGYIECLD